MASLSLNIKTDANPTYSTNDGDRVVGQLLVQYLKNCLSGSNSCEVEVQSGTADPVAASGTLTLVSVIATDVFVIGPVTFTFTSTPTLETDVEVDGAGDTADAAAAVAAINAHSTVSQVVTATNAAGVITITAKVKGVVGNYINISSVDSTITASGTHLASGAGGATDAAQVLSLGL